MIKTKDMRTPETKKYIYWEMGSRNKKTGKLPKYKVTVKNYKILDCDCPARQFRRYSPCKHMKNLYEKMGHLEI